MRGCADDGGIVEVFRVGVDIVAGGVGWVSVRHNVVQREVLVLKGQ